MELLQRTDDKIRFAHIRKMSALATDNDLWSECECIKERLLGAKLKTFAHPAAKYERRTV